MQGPDYLYFLVDKDNRSYYNNGGTLAVSTLPVALNFTPDGWRDISIKNTRNKKYFALDRSFSIPLSFVEDGAFILKSLYYNYGIDAKCFLLIGKQELFFDATHYGYKYRPFYKGEIDFSNFSHDGEKVTCNVMEGGLVQHVKARENTTYEIDVDVAEAINVEMNGVKLNQSAKYILTNGAMLDDNGNHSVNLVLLGQEGIALNIKGSERVQLGGNTGTEQNQKLAAEKLWFFRSNDGTDIEIEWGFEMTASLAVGIPANPAVVLSFTARILRDDGTVVGGVTLNQFSGPTNVYRTNTFSGSAVISGILPGTSVYAVMAINIVGSSGDQSVFFTYNNENGYFNIKKSVYRHPTTYIKALRTEYVFKQLVNKITNGEFSGESTLLQQFPHIPITCGDAIRGIAGSKIKISLSQFFKSLNTPIDIGMGLYNGKLRIEEKLFWIDYNNYIDLGEVKNLRVSPARDYYFSEVHIGWPSQSYEDVGGKTEFNTTSKFTSPVKRITNTVDFISIIRADSIGIELLRINTAGKTTTDDSGDNDVFFLHIESTPVTADVNGIPTQVYRLDRYLNQFATGIDNADTVFNLFFSPKQCLKRNGNYLYSCFFREETKSLVFQTNDKNSTLKISLLNGTVYDERSDELISLLGARYFIPIMFEFEGRNPVNLIETLEANPVKAFRFQYLGIDYYGIPENVGTEDAKNEAQAFQLLSAPFNNITDLIEIIE